MVQTFIHYSEPPFNTLRMFHVNNTYYFKIGELIILKFEI